MSTSAASTLAPGIFYFPFLHRELAGESLPREVIFLEPGLLAAAKDKPEGVYTPEALPLTGRAAQRFLADLLAEGESLGKDALSLAFPGRSADVMAASALPGFDSAEKKALAAFAATARYSPGPAPAEAQNPDAAELIQAQKLLLLAHELEKTILAAAVLGTAIDTQEQALRQLFASDSEAEGGRPAALTRPLPGEDLREKSLARWQEVLRAWRCFLPRTAIFYTADFSLLPGLDTAQPKPLPEPEAAELFPDSAKSGWRFSTIRHGLGCEIVRLVSGQAAG